MKILYVYPVYEKGGAIVHAEEFIAASRKLGHQIVALPLPIKEGKISRNGFVKMGRFLWHNLSYLCRVLPALWNTRADCVLLRFLPNHTLFFSVIAVRLLSKLVLEVNATRSIEPAPHSGRIEKLLDIWSFKLANRIFVVSNVIKTRLLSTYPSLTEHMLAVIHNGCNISPENAQADRQALRKQLGLERFTTLVGYVGSFQAWHDVNSILIVAGESPPSIGYLIVGDGVNRQKYQQQAEAMQLANIIFTGNVPHEKVCDYVALFDIALLTVPKSWCEKPGGFHGSPLKLFDYMAMAKPVLTTASGDLTIIIEDSVHGYHIAPEDTDTLLQKILYLSTNKDKARELGRQAQAKLLQSYTWKANAQQVLALCSSTLR